MPWINRLCLDCNSCRWSYRMCMRRTLDKHACAKQHKVLGLCLLLFLLPCSNRWLRATFLYKYVQQVFHSSIFTPSDTHTTFYHVGSCFPVFAAHYGFNFFETLLIYRCLPCCKGSRPALPPAHTTVEVHRSYTAAVPQPTLEAYICLGGWPPVWGVFTYST